MLTTSDLEFIDQELMMIRDGANDWAEPDFIHDLEQAQRNLRSELVSREDYPKSYYPMTPTNDNTLAMPCTVDALRSNLKFRHRLTVTEMRDLFLACFVAAMYIFGDLAFLAVALMIDSALIAFLIGFTVRHTLNLDREAISEAGRLIVRAYHRTRWMSYEDFMSEQEQEEADVITE